MKNGLTVGQSVYIEYSDQLWNPKFSQYQWNYDQAYAMVTTGGWGSVLNYDGINDPQMWARRRIALKTKAIGDIFRYVWNDTCDPRIRPVITYQVPFLPVYFNNSSLPIQKWLPARLT